MENEVMTVIVVCLFLYIVIGNIRRQKNNDGIEEEKF